MKANILLIPRKWDSFNQTHSYIPARSVSVRLCAASHASSFNFISVRSRAFSGRAQFSSEYGCESPHQSVRLLPCQFHWRFDMGTKEFHHFQFPSSMPNALSLKWCGPVPRTSLNRGHCLMLNLVASNFAHNPSRWNRKKMMKKNTNEGKNYGEKDCKWNTERASERASKRERGER